MLGGQLQKTDKLDGIVQDRTAPSTLLRNTALNVVGQAMPLVIGLLTAPGILHRLGLERYAILSISWVLVGYFSIFDIGVGRAVTHAVAQRFAKNERKVGDIVWPSFRLALVLGVLGCTVLVLFTPLIAEIMGRTREAVLGQELRNTLLLLALSLPWVTSSSILRGVLEAQQRFDLTNLVRIPQASLMFLGPWFISRFTIGLSPIVLFLLLTRLAGTLLMLNFVRRNERSSIWTSGSIGDVTGLVRFGAWVTVGSVVAPLLVSIDRFLISGLISLAAVTYYVAAHDLMSRTWLVASSIMSVYFPAFAEESLKKTKGKRLILYEDAIWMMAALSLPLTLGLVAFSSEVLRLWLGVAIAEHSANVLRILGFGGFVAALALVPNMLLQAMGKPKIVALVQIAELPIYISIFVVLARTHNIEGAALAWIIRALVETILLDRFVQNRRDRKDRSYLIPVLVGAGGIVFLVAGLSSLPLRSGIWIVGVAVSGLYTLRKWTQRSDQNPLNVQV